MLRNIHIGFGGLLLVVGCSGSGSNIDDVGSKDAATYAAPEDTGRGDESSGDSNDRGVPGAVPEPEDDQDSDANGSPVESVDAGETGPGTVDAGVAAPSEPTPDSGECLTADECASTYGADAPDCRDAGSPSSICVCGALPCAAAAAARVLWYGIPTAASRASSTRSANRTRTRIVRARGTSYGPTCESFPPVNRRLFHKMSTQCCKY